MDSNDRAALGPTPVECSPPLFASVLFPPAVPTLFTFTYGFWRLSRGPNCWRAAGLCAVGVTPLVVWLAVAVTHTGYYNAKTHQPACCGELCLKQWPPSWSWN